MKKIIFALFITLISTQIGFCEYTADAEDFVDKFIHDRKKFLWDGDLINGEFYKMRTSESAKNCLSRYSSSMMKPAGYKWSVVAMGSLGNMLIECTDGAENLEDSFTLLHNVVSSHINAKKLVKLYGFNDGDKIENLSDGGCKIVLGKKSYEDYATQMKYKNGRLVDWKDSGIEYLNRDAINVCNLGPKNKIIIEKDNGRILDYSAMQRALGEAYVVCRYGCQYRWVNSD